MTSQLIDNNLLRNSPFPDLAKYFKQLLTRHSNTSITDHLLSGLATDALPLRVPSVWIAGFANAPSIVEALRHEESAGIRRLAIKRFGKCLRNETRIKELWDAAGGTPGLLKLLSELSVHDVQSFCHAMGRTSSLNVARETRRRYLTELTMCLVGEHFPEAKYKNPEVRPFVKFYANIVPACTDEFVRAWEDVEALLRAGGRWMDHAHYRHVRQRCMRQLQADDGETFRLNRFNNLLYELPPVQASKYMSQSMVFSLEILEHLGRYEGVHLKSMTINNDLVIPLLRRLARRSAPLDIRAKVLASVARALKPRMKDGDVLDFSISGPVRQTVLSWNRDCQAFEQILIDILRLAPETQRITMVQLGTLLPLVRDSYRYKLLGLLLEHLRPFAKNLQDEGSLRDTGSWPSSIFAALPSEQSKTLLLRLVRLKEEELWAGDIFTSLQPADATAVLAELSRLRPSGNFINWLPLYSQNPIFQTQENQDSLILELYVAPQSADKEKAWRGVIVERQTLAGRAREQEDRAAKARNAVLCAIASGSLDVCEGTLLWARRFNRDFLTVRRMYARDTIGTRASFALLSGIPSDINISTATLDDLRRDVKQGNKIMMQLLETAFQGLREPSFQPYDWNAVFELFNEVTQTRLTRADEVQDTLALSDDEMWDAVWQDTLDTLLSAEEQCLLDEHEKLNARHAKGILGRSSLPTIGSVRPSKCRFVDELAERRDEIWQAQRRAKNADVVLLQAPWPKGQSFQDCLSVILDVECKGYAGRFPYLEPRVQAIVFADPMVVLTPVPTEKDVGRAIAGHVDDYKDALEFWVHAGVDPEDREKRRVLAWDHAVGPLSKARGLSRVQSALFWQNIFQKSLVGAPSSAQQLPEYPYRPDPTLPEVEDPTEPTEWNPDPDPDQWTQKAVELEPTCLDVMLQSTKFVYEDGEVHLHKPSPMTIGTSQEAFWDDHGGRLMKTVAPAGREGLLVVALMLINSKCCPAKRLFSQPFPDGNDVRFPSTYLDEEFLDRKDISEEDGFVILERLSRDAPLTLVAQLCEAMLPGVGRAESGKRDFEQETLRLLKILVESDRPNLVLDLVRKVVIERPDASSFHRHMLTKGLFDRMTSPRARSFIYELAESIKTSLHAQSKRKRPVDWDPPKDAGPIVKVTTVTALAQLLANATFLPGDEAINILSEIFSAASHPDIRVAIIQSLTSILQKTRSEKIKADIVAALEKYAVPVASAVNERSPLSEEDWELAEKTLKVPEVNYPHSKALQPVLDALVETYACIPDDKIVSQLYHRVLLPILDASIAANTRWLRLFLGTHSLSVNIDDLPSLPSKPNFLVSLLRRDTQHRRVEIFTLWGAAVQTNLDPPPELSEAIHTIQNDRKLNSSNAGKHFLSLFPNPGIAALSYAGPQLHTPYLTSPDLGKTGPVPVQLIQELVFRQLDTMILRGDETFAEQDYLLNALARPEHKSAAYEETWERNVRPLIERVVQRIEGIREDTQWQLSPTRQPAVLRETFDLRLQLLTWPGYAPALRQRSSHAQRLQTFAAELRDLVDEMAASGTPYHGAFAQLQASALKINRLDFSALALALAAGWQDRSLAAYLRVEMAEALIQGAQAAREVRDVVLMVAAWKASADERVRMAGGRCWKRLRLESGRAGSRRG